MGIATSPHPSSYVMGVAGAHIRILQWYCLCIEQDGHQADLAIVYEPTERSNELLDLRKHV